MATHSSVLAWRIPGTGQPGGLLSMGSHRVGHDWSNLAAAVAVPCGHSLTSGILYKACLYVFILNISDDLYKLVKILNCGRDGKESACNAEDLSSIPGLGRPPWRREWVPTPVFWPGEFQGQSSLAGYGPWSHKESNIAEWLTLNNKFFKGISLSSFHT